MMLKPLYTKKQTPNFLIRHFTEAISYRVPLPITKVIVYTNTSYPVCPRCSMSIEREYMSFCDRCGQKLSWHLLDHAIICYPKSKKE